MNTLEILQNLYNYNPLTGILTNKDGKEIAYKHHGHLQVHKNNSGLRLVHRIAWWLYYGSEPPLLIDHKNKNGYDNRIKNLRISNKKHNAINSKTRETRLPKHIRYDKHTNFKYQVTLSKPLQKFETLEQAVTFRNNILKYRWLKSIVKITNYMNKINKLHENKNL